MALHIIELSSFAADFPHRLGLGVSTCVGVGHLHDESLQRKHLYHNYAMVGELSCWHCWIYLGEGSKSCNPIRRQCLTCPLRSFFHLLNSCSDLFSDQSCFQVILQWPSRRCYGQECAYFSFSCLPFSSPLIGGAVGELPLAWHSSDMMLAKNWQGVKLTKRSGMPETEEQSVTDDNMLIFKAK